MYYKIFFPIITNKTYMKSILDILLWKTSTEWSLVVTLLMAVPCMVVLVVVTLSSFLSVVKGVSALLVVIATINQQRSLNMSFKLVSCTHRHCVFTIPEELRIFFLKDRSLLNVLFHSVRDVILRMFFKMNKREHFTPGFICVLHTFGRNLKWNPHIHALISEGAAGKKRCVENFQFVS